MGDDVRLGRIAGVAVGASWSLLVILALITWILGSEVLPGAAPDAHPVAYWAVAAVTAIAFLASLLAHELAHSVVARGRGIEVEGITLWMFGGMSRLKGEAPDARTEERMALAGPLASLALGAAMTVLAVLLAGAHAPDVVAAAIAWLGLMNGMLAVFNLLPAYPLDGGRVLRAIIWRRTGDLRRATAAATTIGIRFGYGLMALGAVTAVAGAGLGGIWLALLGWIVLNAARAEQAGFELRHLLRGVRVADVMTPDPVTAPADVTVEALVRHYVGLYRCSAFPVVRADGSAVGLVTLSRLREVPARMRTTLTAGEVATPMERVVTAQPDDLVVDLLARFTVGSGRRALVIDDGAPVGIVTASDVERALEMAEAAGAATTAVATAGVVIPPSDRG
jgi:Zn-dependent protease/predicted transcriptional regulator